MSRYSSIHTVIGTSVTLALALLIPASSYAAPLLRLSPPAASDKDVEIVEQLNGRDGNELKAYREVRERFSARMTELVEDTQSFITFRETQERNKVSQGYDALIDSLEELELSRRDQAVEVFEQFLETYPSSEYSSHVRFRLAELYFEIQKELWLFNMESYSITEEKCFDGDEDACEVLTEMPRIDLTPSINLYQRIILDSEGLPEDQQYEFLDGTFYMLGFSYSDPNSAQRDDELSRQAFQDLVTARPDSALADAAHLFLGNNYFDYNKTDMAIAEYQAVFDKGPEGDYYGEAMYQLAWSYYRLSFEPWEYNRALDTFVDVLDNSEEQLLESGRESDYKPDAIKYMAISFADIAEKGGLSGPPPAGHVGPWPPEKPFDPDAPLTSALQVANEYFASRDSKEYEWDVYVQLGENLTQLAKFEEAIGVYEFLQTNERWKTKSQNPDFQMKIVKLWNSGPFPDIEQSALARLELTNRYNDDTEWWDANRNNPEALANARGYIEASLADVAIEYRIAADRSGAREDYLVAAERFREYLDKFPISDDYYKQQWYLADTLLRAGQFADAAAEYDLLLRSRRNHIYGDGSVYHLMLTHKALLDDQYPDLSALPEDAELDREYPRVDGREDEDGNPIMVQVYKVGPLHQNFIDAADRALAHKFGEATDGADDFKAALDGNRAALSYVIAQIFFHHKRYDDARPRLLEVIEKNRQSLEGSYAAGLLVDSYTQEGDLAKVRLWTSDFVRNPPGPPEMAEARMEDFANLLEGTAFKQCLEFIQADLRKEAAECFMAFMTEFPESEHSNVALFNAANSYQLIGKADRAIELFEQYVNLYPDDKRSEGLYFRIANTYESTFELKQAIKYYERLVSKFPTNIDAAAAWANAAFLKIGIGDYAGAARGFEQYRKKFPDEGDVEKTYYLAGAQWEEVGAYQAKKFYLGYLNLYKLDNPDHAFEAKYKLAQMYKAERNNRKYSAMLDDILVDYNTLAASRPEKLGYFARHYAAESAFREVLASYEVLVSDQLPKDEQKAITLLTETKPEQIKLFIELAQTMLQFQDFEYNSAAIYHMGVSQMYFADLGFSLQPPEDMDPEMQDIFYEVLENEIYPQFYPVQDKAVELLSKVVESAAERGEHNQWVDRAQEALNQMDPRTYPAIKIEKRGLTDATIYPEVVALRVEEPNSKDSGTGANDSGPKPTPTSSPGGSEGSEGEGN